MVRINSNLKINVHDLSHDLTYLISLVRAQARSLDHTLAQTPLELSSFRTRPPILNLCESELIRTRFLSPIR